MAALYITVLYESTLWGCENITITCQDVGIGKLDVGISGPSVPAWDGQLHQAANALYDMAQCMDDTGETPAELTRSGWTSLPVVLAQLAAMSSAETGVQLNIPRPDGQSTCSVTWSSTCMVATCTRLTGQHVHASKPRWNIQLPCLLANVPVAARAISASTLVHSVQPQIMTWQVLQRQVEVTLIARGQPRLVLHPNPSTRAALAKHAGLQQVDSVCRQHVHITPDVQGVIYWAWGATDSSAQFLFINGWPLGSSHALQAHTSRQVDARAPEEVRRARASAAAAAASVHSTAHYAAWACHIMHRQDLSQPELANAISRLVQAALTQPDGPSDLPAPASPVAARPATPPPIPTPIAAPSAPVLCGADIARARYVGQLDAKFLVFILQRPGAPSLVLAMDQHAVHERIRLESLEHQLQASVERQTKHTQLPWPWPGDQCSWQVVSLRESVAVPLSMAARDTAHVWRELLQYWGFNLAIYPAEAHLHTVPVMFGKQAGAHDVLAWLHELRGQPRGQGQLAPCTAWRLRPPHVRAGLASRACRGAVMFGDMLEPSAAAALARAVASTTHAFICAHGRPSVSVLCELAPDAA